MIVGQRQIWDRHQGDQDDTVVLALDGISTLPISTVVKGWVARNLAAPVELAATITNAAAFEVTVALGSAGGWLDSAAIGAWRFVVTADFSDGRGPVTWPEKGHNVIRVHGRV